MLTTGGCLEAPELIGLSCSVGDPCPSPLVCVEGRCAASVPVDASALDGALKPDLGEADSGAFDAQGFEVGPAEAGPEAGVGDATLDDATVDAGFDAVAPDAEDPVLARCREPVAYPTEGWQVRYFELATGDAFGPCFGVQDLAADRLAIDWMNGAPLGTMQFDFATRMTARRSFDAGAVTFNMQHDDGVRVFIDGDLVYEDWTHGRKTGVTFTTPYLAAGLHDVVIEHYDDEGEAEIEATWARGCTALPSPGTDWVVTYHRLSPTDALIIDECFGWERVTGIGFDGNWQSSSPTPVAQAGVFDGWGLIARAVRDFGGEANLILESEDGYRVYLDNTLVFSRWQPGPSFAQGLPIFSVGPTDVRVEKFDRSGNAEARFTFQTVCDVLVTLGPSEWFVAYYAVGGMGPLGYFLDRNVCLGASILTSEQLVWTTPSSVPTRYRTSLWGAEYQGRRTFATDTRVNLTYDDGIRFYVDAQLVYEDWEAPVVRSGSGIFGAGTYDLRIEYFQEFGGAQLRVEW